MLGMLILLATAAALTIAILTAMLAWEMVHPPRRNIAYALAHGLAIDPSELDLHYEEWTLDRPDGAALRVWEISDLKSQISNLKSPISDLNAQAEPPLPLTAVFIHGWGHSKINSLARIGPFKSLVNRIVLYDLRGHGESTGSCSRLGDREDDDLLALLERLGEGRYLLAGHSMGAVIALNAAGKANAMDVKIVGVIAYGPYCEFAESLRGRLRAAGYPPRPFADLALFIHRVFGLKPLSLHEDDLATIPCPALLFHGPDDPVCPMHHARRIAAASGRITLHEIAGAGHADTHSIDAAQHDAIVQAFVESV